MAWIYHTNTLEYLNARHFQNRGIICRPKYINYHYRDKVGFNTKLLTMMNIFCMSHINKPVGLFLFSTELILETPLMLI